MILLQREQTNQIALTLSELASVSVPNNWLFRFVLDQDDSYEYLIFLPDESTSQERYNLFTLIEGTDLDFKFIGDYLYEVYQMPDQNDTDYTRGSLVENGKMRLIETDQTDPTFEPNTQTPIYDPTDFPGS